eukprot:TRINITY_DN5784_c0_g1_i1.p1 TRINITY_DN5784_c0_g1~~TRINITY_DN5784_c0_g1_i1.p1  ORF type:complete len:453 (+),score=55.65 TRINITY_DN5784_c0_g1_i1:100-1458(+)
MMKIMLTMIKLMHANWMIEIQGWVLQIVSQGKLIPTITALETWPLAKAFNDDELPSLLSACVASIRSSDDAFHIHGCLMIMRKCFKRLASIPANHTIILDAFNGVATQNMKKMALIHPPVCYAFLLLSEMTMYSLVRKNIHPYHHHHHHHHHQYQQQQEDTNAKIIIRNQLMAAGPFDLAVIYTRDKPHKEYKWDGQINFDMWDLYERSLNFLSYCRSSLHYRLPSYYRVGILYASESFLEDLIRPFTFSSNNKTDSNYDYDYDDDDDDSRNRDDRDYIASPGYIFTCLDLIFAIIRRIPHHGEDVGDEVYDDDDDENDDRVIRLVMCTLRRLWVMSYMYKDHIALDHQEEYEKIYRVVVRYVSSYVEQLKKDETGIENKYGFLMSPSRCVFLLQQGILPCLALSAWRNPLYQIVKGSNNGVEDNLDDIISAGTKGLWRGLLDKDAQIRLCT